MFPVSFHSYNTFFHKTSEMSPPIAAAAGREKESNLARLLGSGVYSLVLCC